MSQRATSTNSDFHDLIEMTELSGNSDFYWTGAFGGGFNSIVILAAELGVL